MAIFIEELKVILNHFFHTMKNVANKFPKDILNKIKISSVITGISILISCNASNVNKSECNENTKFKEIFFHHVENIEKNIGVLQGAKFRESVIFVSNYAPVSVNELMNYSRNYPIGIFEKDRIKWTQWYEENKCRNIQLKHKLMLPEAYDPKGYE